MLLSLGACFRVAVNYTAPRPLASPAWYHSKPCFYCFNFVIELLVVYVYTASRFDRRFHVPNGCAAPGHYSGQRVLRDEKDATTALPRYDLTPSTSALGGEHEVNREADVFGDEGAALEDPTVLQQQQRAWEARALEEMKQEDAIFPSAA